MLATTIDAPWRAFLSAASTSPAVAAVLDAIPDARAHLAAFAHLDDLHVPAPPTEDAAFVTTRDHVIAALVAGDPPPPEVILERCAGVAAGGRVAEVLGNLQRETRAQLGRLLNGVLAAATPVAYGVLSDRLHELVDAARAAGLAGLTSADDAIRQGREAAWRQAAQLADAHRDLRRAQRLLDDAHLERVTTRRFYDVAATISGGGTWAGFHAFAARGLVDATDDLARFAPATESAPWPRFGPDAPGVPWLAFAVSGTGPGQVWLPDPGQLEAELQRLAFVAARGHLPEDIVEVDPAERAAADQTARAIGYRIPTERQVDRQMKRAANAHGYGLL